jgi:uncharacterized protein YacL
VKNVIAENGGKDMDVKLREDNADGKEAPEKMNAVENGDAPRKNWRQTLDTVFNVIFAVAVGAGVFWLVYKFSDGMEFFERIIAICATTSIGVMVAVLMLSPLLNFFSGICGHIVNHLFKMPLQDIVSSVLGLIVGLVIAGLLNAVIGKIPVIGPYISVVSLLIFAYVGMTVAYRKRAELMNLLNWRVGLNKNEQRSFDNRVEPKILDTSVIIDGRVADICRSGFLEGQLVIANFVLDELRHIADLPDVLKRNRGRRGLDILNRMQKEMPGRVVIVDDDYPDIAEVDNKLLRLAQDMKGAVLTNDYNLAKVGQVHGVRILNINELSNALRAVWLPGETITVDIVQAGKEQNQGLAYLDDGTMIVVENGRGFIGQQVAAEVSSVLQTSAGRMIFARVIPVY